MKDMLKGLAVVMLIVAGLVGTASAQEPTKIRAMKIDFDFHAGKQLMPAGEYEFEMITGYGSQKLLRVREINTNQQVLLPTIANNNKKNLDSGSVGFNKYGDQYFLSGVQLGYPNYFHTVTKTSIERDVARNFDGRRILAQTSNP